MRVAREALGSEGQVVPQQWLAQTTAPHVRIDLVVYGALNSGGAQCCDATLASPLARSGHPQPCAAAVDGAALRVADGWALRWWSLLSVAVHQAVASTALGGAWLQPLQPEAGEGSPLESILAGGKRREEKNVLCGRLSPWLWACAPGPRCDTGLQKYYRAQRIQTFEFAARFPLQLECHCWASVESFQSATAMRKHAALT